MLPHIKNANVIDTVVCIYVHSAAKQEIALFTKEPRQVCELLLIFWNIASVNTAFGRHKLNKYVVMNLREERPQVDLIKTFLA